MSRRPSRYNHGPTPRELEIEYLRDQGLAPDEIAKELGLSCSTVRSALQLLFPNPATEDERIRAATRKLGAAITSAYPEGIPS